MGRSDKPLEKRGSVPGVIPGEGKGLVRKCEGKIDPIKSSKVDLLRGKGVRRPVWIVGHYERVSVVGINRWWGRERRRSGEMKKRSSRREKAKERQQWHRKNKGNHIKKIGTSPECNAMGSNGGMKE